MSRSGVLTRGSYSQPAALRWVSAAVLLASGVGCAPEPSDASPVTGSSAGKVRSIRLVDPQVWEAESDFFSADSGVHFRVEIVSGTRTDTVPDVLVLTMPVMSPDSLSVSGVALGPHDIVQGIFSYDVVGRTLELKTNPGPGYTPYSEPSLSADGTQLAYLGNDRNYHFWLAVLAWPSCDVVIETPKVQTRCTDFWGNFLRWIGADSLELYMNLCDEQRWARASGTIRPVRFAVDTVGIEALEALRSQPDSISSPIND